MKRNLFRIKNYELRITLYAIAALFIIHNSLFISPALADQQVYPPPPAITPYGDGASDATGAGWTNTHLLGQSFIVPAGINKITKIRLTNFKLGAGAVSGGGSNKGGIVSVALFQGEPTTFNQCWNRGLGGDECTNVIVPSPSGARIVKKEKVYIGDNEVPNTFNELCGWNGRSYPDNNIITYLLKRLKINDPNKPCPKKSELVRMYNMFFALRGPNPVGPYQAILLEWLQGRDYPCSSDPSGTCSIDGWWDPNLLPDDYGGSDFLWENNREASYYGSGATYFEGPGWTTQSDSWQGTDSAGNYIDVALPDNTVVPEQTYFISIQQSHTNPNNDPYPDRNDFRDETDEYYDSGQWNCENPNEAINATEPGYVSIPRYMSGLNMCDGGNVFVAKISRNDPYWFGRAYINSDKWAGDSNADVTDLTIQGKVATPTGQNNSCSSTGATLSWSAISGVDSYRIRVKNKPDTSGWVDQNDFVVVADASSVCSGSTCSITTGLSSSPGVTVSFCPSGNCSDPPSPAPLTGGPANLVMGDPYRWSAQAIKNGDNSDISGEQSFTCAALTPPPSAPTCDSPVDGTTLSTLIDPSNLEFTWGTVTGATSYSFNLDWLSGSNWLPLFGGSFGAEGTSYIVTTTTDASGNIVPIIRPGYMLNFRWQVWASNAGGAGPTRTCSFSLPQPSISTFFPTPDTAGGAVDDGPPTTSGLRTSEGGKSYKNGVNFSLNLSNTTAYNTLLEGVALVGTFPLPGYGLGALYDLTRSAYDTGGFVVVYNPALADTLEWYYNPFLYPPFVVGPSSFVDTRRFKAGNFFVYYNGVWNTVDKPDGYLPGDPNILYTSPGRLEVRMKSTPLTPSNPEFNVTFLKLLGSHTWGTYGYLKQIFYQTASSQYFDLTPRYTL
ncbi:hypothetical protein A3J19_02505 [Candidatus Daviesbacteria bacterium RIFCSPLOWO2_02_FULL_41_8]|uniref:Uncharacterized protein n=2 Tax=Candidatus Daviesiibacteriota TaxID=1752718 RepID=A0A1F5NGC5_9BACT|nr:MAG: hypothetical protein A2871_02195 [Candidatus Daviesbacteria bacterium RIFCSPHIGHO2_01_FULL_41_23]OGE76719.1 MAG: hypothetical protein A3J19_02505 [Candidatus Daviesbacteria bacterium RIFCSPLOWO2_02_FULL_41_8]